MFFPFSVVRKGIMWFCPEIHKDVGSLKVRNIFLFLFLSSAVRKRLQITFSDFCLSFFCFFLSFLCFPRFLFLFFQVFLFSFQFSCFFSVLLSFWVFPFTCTYFFPSPLIHLLPKPSLFLLLTSLFTLTPSFIPFLSHIFPSHSTLSSSLSFHSLSIIHSFSLPHLSLTSSSLPFLPLPSSSPFPSSPLLLHNHLIQFKIQEKYRTNTTKPQNTIYIKIHPEYYKGAKYNTKYSKVQQNTANNTEKYSKKHRTIEIWCRVMHFFFSFWCLFKTWRASTATRCCVEMRMLHNLPLLWLVVTASLHNMDAN